MNEYIYVFEKTRQRKGYDALTVEGVADTHEKMEELLKVLRNKYPEDGFTIYKFKKNSLECEDSYYG